MSNTRAGLALALVALLTATATFATTTHRTAASHTRKGHKPVVSYRAKTKGHKMHGQQAIDPNRVTQIQSALIREHYMSGEANGQWDATTQAAIKKYQSDQGWQTKLLPDSRAIKKLGLGPDYSTAINAKESSFAPPAPAATIPSEQAAGFASASGVNR